MWKEVKRGRILSNILKNDRNVGEIFLENVFVNFKLKLPPPSNEENFIYNGFGAKKRINKLLFYKE